MKIAKYLVATAGVAMVVGMMGCDGKVTGGGTIPSKSGVEGEKANFGFNGKNCGGEVGGKFNYHDKDAAGFNGGVKLLGDVVDMICENDGSNPDSCLIDGKYAIYIFAVEYSSTNPKAPGDGTALVAALDLGEGQSYLDDADGDILAIDVESGPYNGYYNEGLVQGNIQAHNCPGAS